MVDHAGESVPGKNIGWYFWHRNATRNSEGRSRLERNNVLGSWVDKMKLADLGERNRLKEGWLLTQDSFSSASPPWSLCWTGATYMIQNPDCLNFPCTSMRALLSSALKLSWGQGRLARHYCSHSKYRDFLLMLQFFHKKSNFPPREFPSIYCLSGKK